MLHFAAHDSAHATPGSPVRGENAFEIATHRRAYAERPSDGGPLANGIDDLFDHDPDVRCVQIAFGTETLEVASRWCECLIGDTGRVVAVDPVAEHQIVRRGHAPRTGSVHDEGKIPGVIVAIVCEHVERCTTQAFHRGRGGVCESLTKQQERAIVQARQSMARMEETAGGMQMQAADTTRTKPVEPLHHEMAYAVAIFDQQRRRHLDLSPPSHRRVCRLDRAALSSETSRLGSEIQLHEAVHLTRRERLVDL